MTSLTPAEIKEIELRAYGKRITFHTRFHWILTWLEEQPGKNLADKAWSVIDKAYRADYSRRGRVAMGHYFDAADTTAQLAALSEACEYFGRAGLREDEERARDMLRATVYQQYKQVAAS